MGRAGALSSLGEVGLSYSSPSSPPNALEFHHEACGGARITSVTAVTAPCVSFTTLYTLLKKKLFLQTALVVGWLFSSSGRCCLAGAVPAAPTGNGAGAAEGFGWCWGWRGLQQQAVGATPGQCCTCQGVGVASQTKVRVLAKQHNVSICNSCSVCPCGL